METELRTLDGSAVLDVRSRRMLLGLAVLLALAVAAWSVFASGNGDARSRLAALALLVGLPTALLGEFLGPRRGAHVTRAFAIACAGAWLALPLGGRYDAWRAERTRAWCEGLVERIAAFEAERGLLPGGIAGFGAPERPWATYPVRYRMLHGAYTLCFDYDGEDGRTSGYNSKRDLWWVDQAVHRDAWVEAVGSLGPLDPW